MTDRQQQILDTAAVLFAERGFHGVSVHDIGAACGITGPALYKHFRGKGELLAASLIDISETLLKEGSARAASASSPSDALDALIDWHVEFALEHPAFIVVQDREWANLDAAGRRDVRALQLSYIDVWVDTVLALGHGLDSITDRATARAAVQATFGLLNSTPHSARIKATDMRSLLIDMAHRSLAG
ncbi:TetR/AcrR family transcriptional regulator [Aeromicrobium sp.]|uniref:TetR/AcrR family transcriptional regulator n=1 Tax=Aeromicrobium sp. TaxID=1871063 RepID=UPI003D6B6949